MDYPSTPDGDDPSVTQLNKMISKTQVGGSADKVSISHWDHTASHNGQTLSSNGDLSPTLHEEAIGNNPDQGYEINGENPLQGLFRQHSSKGKDTGYSDSDSDQFFLKGDEDDGELISNSGTPGERNDDDLFDLPKKMNNDEVLEAIEMELGP